LPAILVFAVKTAHKNNPFGGSEDSEQRENKKKAMTTIELIKSIAFDFGWTVSTDEEEDTVVFDFRYYTKHQQGFSSVV
jgi:hypothetical protein